MCHLYPFLCISGPSITHISSTMTSTLVERSQLLHYDTAEHFILTFIAMESTVPSLVKQQKVLMVHGCQSICPEQLFLSQRAMTLSCNKGEKRERLKGTLRHFGNNLVLLMLPYPATGDLVSQPHDQLCSDTPSHCVKE